MIAILIPFSVPLSKKLCLTALKNKCVVHRVFNVEYTCYLCCIVQVSNLLSHLYFYIIYMFILY